MQAAQSRGKMLPKPEPLPYFRHFLKRACLPHEEQLPAPPSRQTALTLPSEWDGALPLASKQAQWPPGLILKSQKPMLKAHHLWNIQPEPTPWGSLPLALSQGRQKAQQKQPLTPTNSVTMTVCKLYTFIPTTYKVFNFLIAYVCRS